MIGFIGLGNMGAPMAQRLLDSGSDLMVYNRSVRKTAPFAAAGARVADSIADLRDCSLVISMVSSDAALRAITTDSGGLFEQQGPLPLLVDCSTVSSEVSDELLIAARDRGTDLLAAPVSGGPSVIPGGGLAIVCSGTQASFAKARSVLARIGSKVTYAGEGSASRRIKILHNLLAASLIHSLAETVVLAESLGIARRALLEFINAGALGSPFIGYKSAAMAELDFSAAMSARLMFKDVELGLALAKDTGVALPLITLTRGAIANMIQAGRSELDIAGLLAHLAELNQISLRE